MSTYNPQPLPFFPMPYPGESLYSVLCRYHVRSGNATNRKTILQLFGVFGSLCSTLLLPSMLNCFESWTMNETMIDAEYLFRNHTAYSLCALRFYSECGGKSFTNHMKDSWTACRMRDSLSWPAYRRNSRQFLLQHPSERLRYCPDCAAKQRKLYGESYWQILPQLDGVEYCPVHRTKIATTTIRTRQLLYSFYPADNVIAESTPDYPDSESLWYHSEHIEQFPELFISMAKVISFLWENLPLFSGVWSLLPRYRILLSTGNDFWQSTKCVRTKFAEKTCSPPLIHWLRENITDRYDGGYIYPYSFTLSEHAMMISMLSDSPQHFFSFE